jgi:predicted transcriptional regulator
MRAKEVITLKMENLHYMNKTGKCYLVYSLNKTENISKKSKFDNTNIVQLSEEIFERLLTYIVDTKDKRDELGTSLIFVSTSTQHKKNISQSNAFKVAVNRQIKKHNIRDENGKIWNFTVRQCRKKLASDMIEGEATVSDIAKQLGHADTRTASKYYAEIRSAKLASMNHVFFQKKFQNNMTEEQLASYTEEERRLLYVDFCLNSREVEYGTCTKHFKDGPCRKRKNTGIIDCASCSKICIGKKHQPKWEKLLEKTIKEKNGLLNFYTNNQITDYKNFREFQRVENAITYYSDVIKNIKEYKYE